MLFSVKKIRLKTMQSDTKIFREVNALSGLSHRNIVRYYTTWIETFEPTSTPHSEDSSTDESTTEGNDGMTSVPDTASERHLPVNGGFHFNIEDFDDLSVSRSLFQSIHFGQSSSPGEEADSTSSGEDGGDDFASLFTSSHSKSQSTGVNPSQTKKSNPW